MASRKRAAKNTKLSRGQDLLITLGIMVVGLLIFTLTTIAFISVIQIRTLSCQRLEPSQYHCNLQPKLMGLIPLTSTPIILQRAYVHQEVHVTTPSGGQGRPQENLLYSVMLITDQGEISLDNAGTAWIGSKQAQVDTINTFIANPEVQSLQVRGELSSLVFVCILPIFMLISFAVVVGGVKSLLPTRSAK